jgi:hypothetical protein
MRRRLIGSLSIVIALVLGIAAMGLLYSVYGRVQTSLRLSGEVVVVEGVITEKLVETRSDRLLPFDPPAYVVRYAFPTLPDGQMRNGEQVVTRSFYHRLGDRLGEQGQPVEVTFRPDDLAVSAVDPRLTFPGGTGWRLGVALGALGVGGVFAGLGVTLARREAAG